MVESATDEGIELVTVVSDRRTAAAHRKARPDYAGAADIIQHPARVVDRADCLAATDGKPDLGHRLLELLAAFRFGDRDGIGPDHLAVVFLQHALFIQLHREIQRRLATQRRQQRIGPLFLDDLRHDLPFQRLDVGPVGHVRIGHDRRGIRIHQDDFVALLAQRLAGLRAGVVKLAGLADDDRA